MNTTLPGKGNLEKRDHRRHLAQFSTANLRWWLHRSTSATTEDRNRIYGELLRRRRAR